MSNQPRVSKGVPSGGQYTHKQQPEAAGVSLAARPHTGFDHPDFGKLNDEVEFFVPFAIDENGTKVDAPGSLPYYGEVLYSASEDRFMDMGEWEVVGGLRHPSEYLGGSLEADVRSEPGMYVLTQPVDLDNLGFTDDSDPDHDLDMEHVDGWVLLRLNQ